MAVINRRDKWVFLCEPHTASRATSEALLKLDGAEQFGHHHQDLLQLTNANKTGTVPLQSLVGYDIICTVRNPLDVLVTHWWISSNSRREEWTFEQWITFNLNNQIVYTPLHRQLWQHCNSFCYYEHLQDDLNHVFKQDVPLGYDEQHKTKHKQHWRAYYSDESLELILMYHQTFLDHFGYIITARDMVVDGQVRDRRRKQIGQGRYHWPRST